MRPNDLHRNCPIWTLLFLSVSLNLLATRRLPAKSYHYGGFWRNMRNEKIKIWWYCTVNVLLVESLFVPRIKYRSLRQHINSLVEFLNAAKCIPFTAYNFLACLCWHDVIVLGCRKRVMRSKPERERIWRNHWTKGASQTPTINQGARTHLP